MLFSLFALAVCSQAQDAPPSFEVASVKENKTVGRGGYDRSTPGRFTARNALLRNVIMSAYEIDQRAQLRGGPGWIDSARFDIEAKAPAEGDKPLIHRMLQSLLAERFHLAVHHENNEIPVYFLVVAKNGPKLHGLTIGGSPPAGPGINVFGAIRGLTHYLSNLLGRPVVDKTGIQGSHNWSMHLQPDDIPSAAVFAALEEQLGLKLESAKAPLDVLVIDHIEKPSAN